MGGRMGYEDSHLPTTLGLCLDELLYLWQQVTRLQIVGQNPSWRRRLWHATTAGGHKEPNFVQLVEKKSPTEKKQELKAKVRMVSDFDDSSPSEIFTRVILGEIAVLAALWNWHNL